MPKLIGFGFFEKIKVRSAVKDAKYCLNRALNDAFSNNDAFQKRVTKYFSDGGGNQSAVHHSVMKTINSIKLLIDTDIYRVIRSGDRAGTNAEAENLPQKKHHARRQLIEKGKNYQTLRHDEL